MYPIIWFVIMTALCVAYAVRADAYRGPQKRFFIDWPHAIAIVLVVMLVGVFVAHNQSTLSSNSTAQTTKGTPSKTTTGSKMPSKPKPLTYTQRQEKKKQAEQAELRQQAQDRAVLAFHAIGMVYAMFAGLVLWRKERAWRYVALLVPLIAVTSFFAWPNQHELSNFVLVIVAVGFSLIGRTATQRGFIVAYAMLVLFDIYAVWGSGLMDLVASNYPGVFPKFLTIDGSGVARGIGAGDAIFAAIACNHIHQHCGIRRAVFFAVACTIGVLFGLLVEEKQPLLIYISPIAIATLLLPQGWLRID